MSKHITNKGSIALRAGRANARRCFGRYTSIKCHMGHDVG